MIELSRSLQTKLLSAALRAKNELKMILCMYPMMPDGGALEELEATLEDVLEFLQNEDPNDTEQI